MTAFIYVHFHFLGITAKEGPTTKTIRLLQTGLIEQVIKDVSFNVHINDKHTLTDAGLYTDKNGPL
jgi:hypothetical protein